MNAAAKASKNIKATTAVGGVEPGDKGIAAAAAAATGVGTTTLAGGALAGGALDCLDSELGRALAEGRLQNKASREVPLCLETKILRCTSTHKPVQGVTYERNHHVICTVPVACVP